MKSPRIRQQAGYALILIVLGLMGVGGVVLAGFTQQAKQDVEQQRYLHNQRVLEEAKEALLMYAYNYPQIALAELGTVRGPGRLPCPDTNSSGTDNNSFDCIAGDAMVGRFPWNAAGMNFYEARDASGEHLWYAVSRDFARSIAGVDVVNSDSLGSITISDQTGALVYDADPGVATGVAAVIIAPGPPISRDEDDDGIYEYAQNRAVNNDPRNYLDTYNAFDNSAFINDESDSDDDGFIYGPVYEDDPNSAAFNTVVVNDQMIVITTEELIEVAEKAVFQAYRDALNEYQANTGVARYPWLDPYDSNDGLGTYNAQINPAPPAPIVGRLPSIFNNYFTNYPADTLQFVSELKMKVDLGGGDSFSGGSFAGNTYFKANGDLVAPVNNGNTIVGWAWDGHLANVPTLPADNIWEPCPYVTGTEEDCNQDIAGNFIGGTVSGVWLRVRRVTYDVNGTSPVEYLFADRTAAPITFVEPTSSSHAYVEAEYSGPLYISNVTWVQDDNFQNSWQEDPIPNNGTWTPAAGDNITVGVRYYPVLPQWVTDNFWHDMMQVTYSASMQPGGDGDCTLPANDCLTLQYPGGVTKEKPALLILSGREGNAPDTTLLFDEGGALSYFEDDLGDIFAGENADDPTDRIYDYQSANINDVVFSLE